MKLGDKLRQFLLDPVLLIGTVASLAVPVVLYQKGAEGNFSFLVGLLLFVVTLQIQVILADKVQLNKQTMYGKTVEIYENTSWMSHELSTLLTLAEDATQKFRSVRPRDARR